MAQPDPLQLTRSIPQSAFRRVSVVFPTADTDVAVPHDLKPMNPEDVEYYVVRVNGPADIYDDQSATRIPWRADCLYLRASADDVVADLLLILPAPAKDPRPVMKASAAWEGRSPVIFLGGSRTHTVQVP